jgi:hypothetical protein
MGLFRNLLHSASRRRELFAKAPNAGRCLAAAAVFTLLLIPSLWLLTHPFGWICGLEAMAMGTAAPLLVFGAIGAIRLLWRDDAMSGVECAGITLCFACLQAYIFNTTIHPENRFNLVGGLLPNSDPSMFLSLANQWLDGIRPAFTSREFFPCFLSTMLWICQRDLKIIVSIFTLVTGVLTFLAWRQVRIIFGWMGATLFVTLVFFFYRSQVVGLLRTEQLGLWFALVALALMLQGLREKREGLWCTGLFSLVMGLNTRAGPYLMLPLLVLYCGWLFGRGRWGWRSIMSAAIVCLAGMLLELACYWIFFAPPRAPSNFWVCFYGMLKGGTWMTAMSEVGHNYGLAREKALVLLRAKPWLVLDGFFRACRFVWDANTFYAVLPTAETFRSCMKWFTLLGAVLPWSWSLVQKRRGEVEWFVLLVLLGALFSLPFAPPWDGGRRVYAVALPFIYLSPAMLTMWSWLRLRSLLPVSIKSYRLFGGSPFPVTARPWLTAFTRAALAILTLLSTVVPLCLMVSHRHVNRGWSPNFCVPLPDGCAAKDLPSGYQIHLISDAGRTFVPWIRVSDFRRTINDNWEAALAPSVVDLLKDLPEGTTIATACHSRFFVIETDKAKTTRLSQRHPILNPSWHRVIYDNDFPLSPHSREILSQPKPPLSLQK